MSYDRYGYSNPERTVPSVISLGYIAKCVFNIIGSITIENLKCIVLCFCINYEIDNYLKTIMR